MKPREGLMENQRSIHLIAAGLAAAVAIPRSCCNLHTNAFLEGRTLHESNKNEECSHGEKRSLSILLELSFAVAVLLSMR
ncbi:hypothetical protein BDA96_08G091800 [Sorghum bicolor]|uniref:Uncharacterized protein n=2 Tax=Sorghum bicolor TaxID=4558 RepID=A0A921U7N8_SORBI|nr:hypothetical protein BDA96_08G091800 [Sorghum bicolor]KXG23338.1 hypothetical protein SORBI_3008G085200 [Sorghum bicolor]